VLPELIPDYGLMTVEAESDPLDTKLSPGRLERVVSRTIGESGLYRKTAELGNPTALTLIDVTVPCSDAPTRQGIPES
jgi:hypothetical protein